MLKYGLIIIYIIIGFFVVKIWYLFSIFMMINILIWFVFLILIVIWVRFLKNSSTNELKNAPDPKSWIYIMNPTYVETWEGDYIFSFSKLNDDWNLEGIKINISSKQYKRLEVVYPYNPYVSFEIIYEWNGVKSIILYKKWTFSELWNIEDINWAKLIWYKNIIFLSNYVGTSKFKAEPFKMITNDTDSALTLKLQYGDWKEDDEIIMPPYGDYIGFCPHEFTIKIV